MSPTSNNHYPGSFALNPLLLIPLVPDAIHPSNVPLACLWVFFLLVCIEFVVGYVSNITLNLYARASGGEVQRLQLENCLGIVLIPQSDYYRCKMTK